MRSVQLFERIHGLAEIVERGAVVFVGLQGATSSNMIRGGYTLRRVGAPEDPMLVAQSNIAGTYRSLGRLDDCLRTQRDVYSGRLKLHGIENEHTLRAAGNYAWGLFYARRFEEAKVLMRKTIPVARRVLGDSYDLTLMMRWVYARALYEDDGATLNDLREAAETLAETERTARRVLGSAHPDVSSMENALQEARAALAAREGTKIN